MAEFDEILHAHRVEEKLSSIAAACIAAGVDFDGDDAVEVGEEANLEDLDTVEIAASTVAAVAAVNADAGADEVGAEQTKKTTTTTLLTRRNRTGTATGDDAAKDNAGRSKKRRVVEPAREARMRRCAAKNTEVLRLTEMLGKVERERDDHVQTLKRRRVDAKRVAEELQRICDDEATARGPRIVDKIFEQSRNVNAASADGARI